MEGYLEMHVEPPPQPEASVGGSFYTPLLISLACMFGTCFAIVTYHIIAVKLCMRRHRRQIAAEILARGSRAVAGNLDFPVGVEEKVLRTIPVLSYSGEAKLGGVGFRLDQRECVVCLGELEEGAAVRVLPSCRHVFHVICIDRWFLAHSSCPVCRAPVVAVPKAAPHMVGEPPCRGSVGDDIGRVTSTSESARLCSSGLLRRCVSFVMPVETGKPPRGRGHYLPGLNRSLSVDQSLVVINITAAAASSSSSSSSSRYAGNPDATSCKLLGSFSQINYERSSNEMIQLNRQLNLRL